MSDRFNYDKAEADLFDSGCHHSEDIYGYRSEKGINEFMRENGLNPDRYYGRDKTSGGHNGSKNTGGCFITTACIMAMGLPDDCYELTVLRGFRDNYLKNRENGAQDIADYYRNAPQIVESISNRNDADQIWRDIYQDMVCLCIQHIEAHEFEKAYKLYKSFTIRLRKEYLRV